MSMEIINLIALIVVPIAAVYIGQKLQDREQKRKDKIQIFKILMTSRIFGWTNDSVQAMNLIDVVFANSLGYRFLNTINAIIDSSESSRFGSACNVFL